MDTAMHKLVSNVQTNLANKKYTQ